MGRFPPRPLRLGGGGGGTPTFLEGSQLSLETQRILREAADGGGVAANTQREPRGRPTAAGPCEGARDAREARGAARVRLQSFWVAATPSVRRRAGTRT